MRDFKKLLERGKMGPLTLENRLIMAPMGSLNADSNGYITDNALAFYKDQAKGGLSMVIVECTATDDDLSRGEDNVMCLYDNGQITGMARLASTIKDQGAVAILQLCHIGHQLSLADRKESLGPSTMFEMQGGIRPFPIRGLTIPEINQIIDDFGKAAWRAKMAGFDLLDPCRVSQRRSSDANEIGNAGFQRFFREFRCRESAVQDDRDLHARILYGFCRRDIIAALVILRIDDTDVVGIAAYQMQRNDAGLLQFLRVNDALLDRDIHRIEGIRADAADDRETLAAGLLTCFDDLDHEADPVLRASAVFVCSVVVLR